MIFMSTKTIVADELETLKKKLNAAIDSRASLAEDFSTQSSLLIQFINKLSHVSKGINLELDNRLAQLRGLLTKSAPFADIEHKTQEISKLLQRHAVTNEQQISTLNLQLKNSGESLQKTKGLPNELRRQLRALLKETETTKETISQYIPLFSQLLALYDSSTNSKKDSLQSYGDNNQAETLIAVTTQANADDNSKINSTLILQISNSLHKLQLSTQHTKELLALNKKLLKDTSNDEVFQHFIEIFDVIVADLQDERDSAQTFLATLNDTLTTVQSAVKKALVTNDNSQSKNNAINAKLQSQILDMTGTVEKAMSLSQVKVDINDKLQTIARTIEQKSKFEQQCQKALSSQLNEMSQKVKNLEAQSIAFEDKLAEQHRRSMQDALTKLSNRAAFDEYFTKAMVRFHHQPFELSLVVIDIDNFKSINDTYGHTAGDKTLQVIADTIQKKVNDEVFVARYGGEEFVLIYSNGDKDKMVKTLNAINKNIARLPFKFKNKKVSITLSIGVTHIQAEDNIHTAFERADEAMYKAKAQGKNQVIYLQ